MSVMTDVLRSLDAADPGKRHAISAKDYWGGIFERAVGDSYSVWQDPRTDMYVICSGDHDESAFADFQRIR